MTSTNVENDRKNFTLVAKIHYSGIIYLNMFVCVCLLVRKFQKFQLAHHIWMYRYKPYCKIPFYPPLYLLVFFLEVLLYKRTIFFSSILFYNRSKLPEKTIISWYLMAAIRCIHCILRKKNASSSIYLYFWYFFKAFDWFVMLICKSTFCAFLNTFSNDI